jgi:isoleucyl-tRNA synthetase
MSKSLGNVISPMDLMKTQGADILRLWTVSTDYSEDIRIGKDILEGIADSYRRLRNTLRYLLGSLAGFTAAEKLPFAQMPELERWVLHRLKELEALLASSIEAYDFDRFYGALHNFCATELSAFYFDVRKDALYCDPLDSTRRRAARTVLDTLFECLTLWLAPVLAFTAEEAWLTRHPGESESVHLQGFPTLPETWRDEALARRWARVREVRRVVTGALELARKERRIGASLQAAPRRFVGAEDAALLEGLDLAELAITSDLELVTSAPPDGAYTLDDVLGVGVVATLAEGAKCARCWRVLPEVEESSRGLCHRCEETVAAVAA